MIVSLQKWRGTCKGANEPDRANRRQPLAFRKLVGEASVSGFTAAVAHLECSARSAHEID
jgi:hypothetical protein